MKRNTLGGRLPKYGGLTRAASLGLLLLLGGCVATFGQPDKVVSGNEGASEEPSSPLIGLFGKIRDTVQGQKESLVKFATGVSSSNKSATEPIDHHRSNRENLKLPAPLVNAIQTQKMKSMVEDAAAKEQQKDQDKIGNEKLPIKKKPVRSLSKNTIKKNPRRNLSKSKNKGGGFFPPVNLPSRDCRCEYPSENIYRPGQTTGDEVRDGLLILPGDSAACRDVLFICDRSEIPNGYVEFTCPNLNVPQFPVFTGKAKGKGKGNKNKNGFPGCGVSKGKGKGNKNKGNIGLPCPPLVPPGPTGPQYVLLPRDDPDCRPPTPNPTPRPPPPTPDPEPPCEEPYEDWVECVDNSDCSGCEMIPSSPGGWLIPGEECNVFEDWFPLNFACCSRCADELAAFQECKDCDLPPPPPTPPPNQGPPSSSRPTPRPTPPSPPPPPTPPTELPCEDPYDDWVQCVRGSRGCNDCAPIPDTPGGWLIPEEECGVFEDWFPLNYECCAACADELKAFEDCKECNLPPPTPPAPKPSRRPTPRPTPPSPPPPTKPPLPCEIPYDKWLWCTKRKKRCRGCAPIPDTPGGWLIPGEECDVFEDWFPLNYDCCPKCADELSDFEECKECEFEPPTPTPTIDIPVPGEVRGVVFEDVNGNGVQDDNEPGIDDVDVVITDSSGVSQTVTTGRTGRYSAVGVPAGPAVITIVETTLPPGFEQTAGENPTDVDVPEGGVATDADGYQRLLPTPPPTPSPTLAPPTPPSRGKIKGVVFEDINGNGIRDDGEPGIDDVDVVITDSSGASQTVTTRRTGRYSVDVPAGPADIVIDEDTLPSGATQTAGENPTSVTVPSGGTATDEDGYQILGKVKGTVFEDTNGNGVKDRGEPGIEDVDVIITESSGASTTVTTSSFGMYMAEVPRGTTEIDIDEDTIPEGFTQTAGNNPSTVTVPGGGTATDEDGYQPTKSPTPRPTPRPTKSPTAPRPGKVEGVVFEDVNGNGEQDPGEPGIEDVDVVITDSSGASQTVTTDDDGEYEADVPAGSTEIDIDEDTLPDGYKQTAGEDPTTVEVPAGGTATDEDGYQILGKVKGTVFEDTNGNGIKDRGEPGISNVDVIITDSSGAFTTVTTSSFGMYMAEVPRGTTEIGIDEDTIPEGFTQTAGINPSTVTVPGGGTATDEDGYQPRDSPTPRPTLRPTKRPPTPAPPTKKPPTAPPPTPPGGCVNVIVDFETDADGNALAPGEFVENEWAEYGLILTASGGFGDLPRLFDSTDPGSEDTCGDSDLGAPNEACNPPGPGTGDGGAPGEEGENCDPLGNILIVQEPDAECPDDNLKGGMIFFDFVKPAEFVYEMEFLDTDYATSVTVAHTMANGMEVETVFDLKILEDNSKQKLEINIENVKQVKVAFTRSGAVTFISFCPCPVDPPPTPTPGTCVDAEITFDELPDGTVLEPAEYLSDQYEPFYGVSFSSAGKGAIGFNPRLFDSANPGQKVDGGFCGDKDLGAPNRECPDGGPGKGEGGEPGPNGNNPYKNCSPQGNILIIQEDNLDNRCGDIPDDNQEGGVITMDFSTVAEEVYEITVLDVDYPISITCVYIEDGKTKESDPIDVEVTGDNSLQTVDVNCKNVVQLRLNLKRSGAVTSIRFCSGKSGNERRELGSLRAAS